MSQTLFTIFNILLRCLILYVGTISVVRFTAVCFVNDR